MQPSSSHWFRNTVLYQIYPRSFFDSSGDGVGDLRGITQRLRYLNGDEDSLGVGVVWLSPFYPSPMKDFGYDVTDHCGVDPLFGNLDDFTQLLTEAHKRGIKVFIDLIPNHTSDQHQWFKESRSSKDNLRRNWYTWADPGPDGGPPNNWLSVFGGSAWELDATTGQYYLHSYLTEQPDINWENAGAREAIKNVMRFWLDYGVDGFRVDAISAISKDPKLRDDPINHGYKPEPGANPYHQFIHTHSKEGLKLFSYLEMLATVLHSYDDRFMIFEASPATASNSSSYFSLYGHVDPSVSAPFNFEGIHSPWNAQVFKGFIDKFQTGMHPLYVPVYAMSNHDQSRLASRIGSDQARAAAVMQFGLPGMPVVYYGDELGMKNGEISQNDIKDPVGLRVPKENRDKSRTPMQWSDMNNAGFSEAKPWLPVNKDYIRRNVDVERLDPTSFYSLYRNLIKLRQKHESLRAGSYESIDMGENVFCFERRLPDETIITIINFSDTNQSRRHDSFDGKVLISTHRDAIATKLRGEVHLRPNEAIMLLAGPSS